jgi:hypothetical protein
VLSEQEFRGVLERLVAAYWNGSYQEWREAMRLLAADASPEQWEEVVQRPRGGEHEAGARGPVVRERILAADRRAI